VQAPHFQTADERFSAHLQQVREQDKEDRILEKRKRKEKKLLKKAKARDAARGAQGAAVTLGRSDEWEQASEDEGSPILHEPLRKQQKVTAAYKGMREDSEDDSHQQVSKSQRIIEMKLADREQLALKLLDSRI
jgi:hypothetical protein